MADNNTLKYFSDNILVTQNQIFTLCCCNRTLREIDRYWEAMPCEGSFVPRDSTCLESDVDQYKNRIYIPRDSKCIGNVGADVCECQTLAFTSNMEIGTGNITNIVTIRQSNIGTHTYDWQASKLVLSTNGGNTFTFTFSNYFNLQLLVNAINAIGNGWSAFLGNTTYGLYSPGFIDPETLTFQVISSPVNNTFDSLNSGIKLKWQGIETPFIEWTGDLSDFATDIQFALDTAGYASAEVFSVHASSGSSIVGGAWTGYYLDILFENECGTVRPEMTVSMKGLINAKDVRMYYGDYENNFPYDLPNWFLPHSQAIQPGIQRLNFQNAGDRFPQFHTTSTNPDFRPQFDRNLQIASLYHSLGNGFKSCSREGAGQGNFEYYGTFPPVHNYNEQCCPQRGGKYGPDQRFSTTTVSGYDHYTNSDHPIFRDAKPRSTFGNLDSTFLYQGSCYNISPWYYLYNKEGFNTETDSATRKKLYQIADCQFGANGFDCNELDHNTPNNCYVELFVPQFHPLVPWGPFGAYHSNIITQFHKAYDYPDSHIAQTYDSGNPVLARYGGTYRPWGYIKTRGSWTATESIELRVSVHRPVPFYIGATEFDDLDLYITISNVDPMFRVTGNNGCGPIGIWVDNPSGYTVGEFVDALNTISIDVSGSTSGVPLFKFAVGSEDARNINCSQIVNTSAELFDEWYRDPDDGNNDYYHSNGPIADDWRFSGSDIIIGPLNNASIHGHHPENLADYMIKTYGTNVKTSYHPNVGIPKIPFHSTTEAGTAADIAEFQDGYFDAYVQLLESHDVNSFICAPPPKGRRKVGLPKEPLEFPLAGISGFTNDELMNYPKYKGPSTSLYTFTVEPEYGPYNAQSSDMWWTNIQGRDRNVLLLNQADHGKTLSSLNVEVRNSGHIWISAVVQESGGNVFNVSGVVNTMPTGEYTVANAVTDLNNLQLSYVFGGVQTFNPVVAVTGIWHPVWFDDRTYTDSGNLNPSYASGVGLVETDYNYSYREPLRDQGPFSLIGRQANLKTFIRNRSGYIKEETPPAEYKLESNLLSGLNYYSEPEPELPPCLPPSATIVPKQTELNCFGDEVVENNWLLSYGCVSYVCNTEWYIRANRCGCNTVLDCSTRSQDPHPVNQPGNSTANLPLYDNIYTVTQPTIYICRENIHPECDIPMLIKVPFMVYKPSTREVITYIDSGGVFTIDDTIVDLTFCGGTAGVPGDQTDILGWCQYIDPSSLDLVRKEDIPLNWPPTAYIMPRGYPSFCSVHPWSFDPEGVICTNDCTNDVFGGRCPSCSNYDRMVGLIPWVDQSDPDAVVPNETFTALFRAVVNPSYDEMCGTGGACREHTVSCGTKCCGCYFTCKADSCKESVNDKIITSTTINRMLSYEEPYQCQLEAAPAGGPGGCSIYGPYGLICDTFTISSYSNVETTSFNKNVWDCDNRLGVAGGGSSCQGKGKTTKLTTEPGEIECPDERGVGVSGCGYVQPYCGVDPGFTICPGRGTCPDDPLIINWGCIADPPVPSLTCSSGSDVRTFVETNCCSSTADNIGQHCGSGDGNDCSVNGFITITEDYSNTLDECGDGICNWSYVRLGSYEGCMVKPCAPADGLNAGLCGASDGITGSCPSGQFEGNLAGWQGILTEIDDAGYKEVTRAYDPCGSLGVPTAANYSNVTGWFERIGYVFLGGNFSVSRDSADFGSSC